MLPSANYSEPSEGTAPINYSGRLDENVRQGQVIQQLNDQDKGLATLAEQLIVLADRLQPVYQGNTDIAKSEETNRPSLAPIAERLYGHNDRIRIAGELVNTLIEGLQI